MGLLLMRGRGRGSRRRFNWIIVTVYGGFMDIYGRDMPLLWNWGLFRYKKRHVLSECRGIFTPL